MPGDVRENTPSEVQKINETETTILVGCFLVKFRFLLVTRHIHLQYFAGPAIASAWPRILGEDSSGPSTLNFAAIDS